MRCDRGFDFETAATLSFQGYGDRIAASRTHVRTYDIPAKNDDTAAMRGIREFVHEMEHPVHRNFPDAADTDIIHDAGASK